MAVTTYTLTKVEPFLGGDTSKVPGSGDTVQSPMYRYECLDNSSPAKKIVIISPLSTLLTPGNNGLSGTNTGSIVVTDTPG